MHTERSKLVEGRYAELDGLMVYYEESGDGNPLILLHGGGLTSEIWKPHRFILSRQFHVFVPDCRGHGRTNNPLKTLSYPRLADDLAMFIKHLNLVESIICGWSMGARSIVSCPMAN